VLATAPGCSRTAGATVFTTRILSRVYPDRQLRCDQWRLSRRSWLTQQKSPASLDLPTVKPSRPTAVATLTSLNRLSAKELVSCGFSRISRLGQLPPEELRTRCCGRNCST